MPVVPALWEAEEENCLNLGGGGCSESILHHSTPAWATRAKLHLKKTKNKTKNKAPKLFLYVKPDDPKHSIVIWKGGGQYLRCGGD